MHVTHNAFAQASKPSTAQPHTLLAIVPYTQSISCKCVPATERVFFFFLSVNPNAAYSVHFLTLSEETIICYGRSPYSPTGKESNLLLLWNIYG